MYRDVLVRPDSHGTRCISCRLVYQDSDPEVTGRIVDLSAAAQVDYHYGDIAAQAVSDATRKLS